MREFVIGEEGYRYRGYNEFSVSNFESLELEFGQQGSGTGGFWKFIYFLKMSEVSSNPRSQIFF